MFLSFFLLSFLFCWINPPGNTTLPYKCPACSFKQTPNSSSFDLRSPWWLPCRCCCYCCHSASTSSLSAFGVRSSVSLSQPRGVPKWFLKTRAWLSQEFLLAVLFDSCPSLQSWLSSALLQIHAQFPGRLGIKAKSQ